MSAPIPITSDFVAADAASTVALKQRIVAAFLHNPFRDDDALALSTRLGEPSDLVTAALRDLCSAQLLKPAADRGFMLDVTGLTQSSGTQPEPMVSSDVVVASEAAAASGAAAAAEVSVAFAHFQEELFQQLRSDVIEPLRVIQDFLENQEPTQLGLARAALEQICWAVRELGLAGEKLPGEGLAGGPEQMED